MSRWIAVFTLLAAASFPAMSDENGTSAPPTPGMVTSIESGLPFVESFESGSLSNWVANAGGSGSPLVQADTTLSGSNVPHTGNYVAFLGASSSGLTTATLDLHMNLSAVDVVEVDFWWLTFGLEAGEAARIDVYDGILHTDVGGLQSQPPIWTNHTITLDRAHYTFSNDVVLRFVAVVNLSEFYRAVYLDDVSVQGFASPDNLVVSPRGNGSSSGMTGGPFTPGVHTYTLYNKGGAALDWTAATAAATPWLDIAPAGGNLAPGGRVDVTATINATANGFATYEQHTAKVDFTNTTGAYAETRSIELNVIGVIYQNLLDIDPGWTTEGDWAYGVPTGGGNHNLDPTAGHTGANVYGYNLAGNYENNMWPYALTSRAYDCSGIAGVHVEFWRWLGVERSRYDHAVFQVSIDGGTWTPIWGNPGDAAVSESAWSQQVYDISSVADGQRTVYLRWVMGPTDNSIFYPGWNIDDVAITGVPVASPVDPSLPPTLTVGAPSRYYARPGQQVSYDLYYEGASEIILAGEDISLLSTGTADADVFITGAGTQQRKARLLNLTGDGWLGLNLDFGTAHDIFGNIANRVAETAWFYVDSTAPNIYISPPTLAITDNGPVTYNVIYSGADGVPLTIPDVLVNATGTASGTVTVLGAGRYSRKVRFNNALGNGRLGFNLDANTAYDFAGNLALGAGPADTFRVDNTPPLNPVTTPPVASFSVPTRWTANGAQQVKYTVAYRDASSISLNMADVVLQSTGTATAAVAVSGAGVLQRKITLYSLAGEGTVGFSLNAGTASNAFGSAPATPVGPIFTLDNTGPGVYVTAPSQRVTTTTPITYTVFYSGADSVTLGPGNVVVQATGTANVGLVQVTGAGRYQRKVKLNNLTGKGAVGISLNAGTAVDGAGNPAPGTLPSIVAQVLN